MYTVRSEGLLYEEEEFGMHFVMTCDDELPVLADESVTHGKVLRATIVFFGG